MCLQIVKPVAKNGLGIVRAYFCKAFREFDEMIRDAIFNSHTPAYAIVSD